MSVVLTVGGTDITADTLITSATFRSAVNGAVGSCQFQVRDDDHSHTFTSGSEITLDVAGNRVWGGYIMRAKRTFALAAMDTTTATDTSRMWSIEGVDYNILFDKRVIRDTTNLNDTFQYAAGSFDDTIINDIYDNYLDISGDGLTKSVTRVGEAIFDIPGVTTGRNTAPSSVSSQGYTWRQVMYSIVRNTGGMYFISPSKVFTYCDVDTASSDYTLTDQPDAVASGIGYRELELLNDGSDMRNDALVWGAGLGSQQVVFSRKQDATSKSDHNRWQIGDFNGGIYKQATADTIADIYVDGSPTSHRGGKNDKVAFTATVRSSVFNVGQKVAVRSNVFGYSDTLPVRSMDIRFANPTDALFRLTLSFDVDAPWSMFDLFPLNFGFKVPTLIWPRPPQGGLGSCADSETTTIFDTFDRTVTVTTFGPIGTSTDGHAYAWNSSSGFSSYGCDGSVFFLSASAGNGNVVLHANSNSDDPWSPDDFTMTWRFRTTTVTTGDQHMEVLIGSTQGPLVQISSSAYDSDAGTGGFIQLDDGGTKLAKSDWVASTWYIAEYSHDASTGDKKMRVYADGDTPPDWQITGTGATSLSGDQIRLAVAHIDTRAEMSVIEFTVSTSVSPDGGTCIDCQESCIDEHFTTLSGSGWGGDWSHGPDSGGDPFVSTSGVGTLADFAEISGAFKSQTSQTSQAIDCGDGDYDVLLKFKADAFFPGLYASKADPGNAGFYFLGGFETPGVTQTRQRLDMVLYNSATGTYNAGVGVAMDTDGNAVYSLQRQTGALLVNDFVEPAPFTFETDTEYSLRLQVVSGEARARLWKSSTVEPSNWPVTVSGLTGTPDHFQIIWKRGTAAGAGSTIGACQIDFTSISVCRASISQLSGLATRSGYTTEIATDSGDHTTYNLTYPFLVGTTEVWVNGDRQRLGLDYTETTSGSITFLFALTSTDTVKVAYWAAGA